jgi:hypothetical protein
MSDLSKDRAVKPTDDYEVGYGKPPRHTRFPKGRSGNPKGRPPRSKNIGTLLTRALNEPVAISENGRRKVITKREAIVAQLVNKSASADLKAMSMLLGLLQQAEGPAPSSGPPSPALADADESVIRSLLERFAASPGGSDGSEPG